MMDYVLSLGHRNIGIITVPEKSNISIDRRLEGIYSSYEDAGFRTDALSIAYGDYSIESGSHAMQVLLETNPTITAVIGINDRMAIGAMQYLQSIGKAVPDDITVVGFDNIELSSMVTPALTTVDQRPIEQGSYRSSNAFWNIRQSIP